LRKIVYKGSWSLVKLFEFSQKYYEGHAQVNRDCSSLATRYKVCAKIFYYINAVQISFYKVSRFSLKKLP